MINELRIAPSILSIIGSRYSHPNFTEKASSSSVISCCETFARQPSNSCCGSAWPTSSWYFIGFCSPCRLCRWWCSPWTPPRTGSPCLTSLERLVDGLLLGSTCSASPRTVGCVAFPSTCSRTTRAVQRFKRWRNTTILLGWRWIFRDMLQVGDPFWVHHVPSGQEAVRFGRGLEEVSCWGICLTVFAAAGSSTLGETPSITFSTSFLSASLTSSSSSASPC